ncbi:MAG: cytochrome C oxidase subunit IV family protein [Ardenticatenia bacterium]|nr:cytochrome C oxidase subunit IV family protein [Ardenticatenia bacterium]
MAEHGGHTPGTAAVSHGAHPNYWLIGVVLSVLTVLELAVTSSYVIRLLNMSEFVTNVALLVFALAKGAFVVAYYMHLKFDSRVYTTMFAVGILFALLLSTTFILLF